MPSPGRVQLNLSVEPEIKESLRKHCEAAGVSFAQAITEYVKACDREGRLLIGNIPNAIPSIDLKSIVTFDQLPFALDSYFSQSHDERNNLIPSTIATQDYVQQAIDNLREELKVITSNVDKKSSGDKEERLIDSSHDNDKIEPPLQQSGKQDSSVVEISQQDSLNLSELLTITQIDSKSLAPLFDDEDEEDADWNKLKVTELRKIITIKGLGQKFREKLGKSPRESRKAEIIKFLEETSIFDCD